MIDSEIRKQLKHLARKYGGGNLLWGAACVLADEAAEPSDFGIDARGVVPLGRAVNTTLSMAGRAGGRARLAELIENGELAEWTQVCCQLDETPQPLTGPVDIRPVHERAGSERFEYWVISHEYCLARFATVAEALEYVKTHSPELDKVTFHGERAPYGRRDH